MTGSQKARGHVTHLTVNHPQKASALSASLVEALLGAVEYACTDGTRLLILDGASDHFCAGFDFSGYLEQSEGDLALRFMRIETLLQQLYHAPFETLVFAHGKNFGAGADLVTACGMRIAAPGTTFRMPGLRFGIVSPLGSFASAPTRRAKLASRATRRRSAENNFDTYRRPRRVACADRRNPPTAISRPPLPPPCTAGVTAAPRTWQRQLGLRGLKNASVCSGK